MPDTIPTSVHSRSAVAKLLKVHGTVAVTPTDTVYGLVCRATDREACARLYELAGRKSPGTVVAASVDQLVGLGLKARYIKPVQAMWPNPISVIIPCGPDLTYLHMGTGGLACRIPADEPFKDMLETTGPLLTVSAGNPGGPPIFTEAEAQALYGDAVDVYLDGGKLAMDRQSTVIRVVDDAVEIVRPGAIEFDENGCIINY